MALNPLVDTDARNTLDHDGFSGDLIDELEVVIPPTVASSILSPLVLIESILGALAETGRGLLIPGLLLITGVGWAEARRRWAMLGPADDSTGQRT